MDTVRDRIAEALRQRPHSALQISEAVGVAQREIADHLEHLRKSLPHRGEVLEIEAARCVACEFVFEDRDRLTRPSRCPACKAQRVQPPRFSVRKR